MFSKLDRNSLQQILETVPSGLFLVDRKQHIIYWNREAEKITGYTAQDICGQHCHILQGVPCQRRCGLFDCADPKPTGCRACAIRGKDNRRIVISKNIDFLRNSAGEIIGGIESFVDISERKSLERTIRRQNRLLEHKVRMRTTELERERRRLNAVLDTMQDLAYITSSDYRIQYMNYPMLELFGDCVGGLCYENIYKRATPCPWCALDEIYHNQATRGVRNIPHLGRFYEVVNTPLHTGEGAVQKLSVLRDVTERKHNEERLQRINKELEAFVYTVSHDLRSPLTPVIGYAQFLRDSYSQCMDATGLAMLDKIEKQGRRLVATLEDLLVLAKVGRLADPCRPTDIRCLIENILAELGAEMTREQVSVTLGPLPEAALPPSLLAQVFTNLLQNALRYGSPRGSTITIGGTRKGDVLRYFVRDQGPGISPAEQERIFDLFYRGTTAAGSTGTGVGLAIVRKIVNYCQGRVWIETPPEGGTTIWVELNDSTAGEGS